jgi:hypothetical protein
MDVEPFDLGDEVGCGLQSRLKLAQVVVVPPVAREFLHRRELHALRRIGDRFRFGPLGRVDALAQVGELGFRKRNLERVASPVFCATPASVMALSPLGELSKPVVPAPRVAAARLMKRRRVNPEGSDMRYLLQQLAIKSGAIDTPP